MPGQANTVSVMVEYAISVPNSMPITVTTGIRMLRRMWRRTMRPGLTPLARANFT